MSSTPVVVNNAVDTSIRENAPFRNYRDATRLRLRSGTGTRHRALIYFARAFPIGSTIQSATLRVYAKDDWPSATRTLTAKRITEAWQLAQTTWTEQPTTTDVGAVTVTTTGAITAGHEFAFDVQQMLQQVADGGQWYGWLIEVDNLAGGGSLGSGQAGSEQPVVEVTYSENPEPPSTLSPSGGRAVSTALPTLRFDFTDVAGNTDLDAVQVQINSTDVWTSPSYDTGTLISTVPEVNLSTVTGNLCTFGDSGTFEANITNWTATTNCSVAQSSTLARTGTKSLRLSSTASGTMAASTPSGTSGIPVTGGQTYVFRAYERAGASTRTVNVLIDWYDTGGSSISTTTGATATDSTSAWTAYTASAESPANAAYARLRVQVASTGAGSELHYFDDATFSIGTAVYTGLTDGSSTWWRVRVRDGAGLWSDWSDGAQYARANKGTVTITNPAAPANNYVEEATPPITWTFSGTQRSYQVVILDADGNWLANSGKVDSTSLVWTVPDQIIHDDTDYTVEVRVWDTTERESTPGDPAYAVASRDFTYHLSVSVTPVSSFVGTGLSPQPGVHLTWSRATAPDSYTIVRDGLTVESGIDPADLLISGTSYEYYDYASHPRQEHTWEVRPVVNGVTSANNPQATLTLYPIGIWLQDPERAISVLIMGQDSGSWEMGEDADIYTPLGARKPIRITQALRGYEGNIGGTIADYGDTTCAEWEDMLWRLKETPGRTYQLTLSDLSIPVIIGNLVITPLPDAEITKLVDFDWWQVGGWTFVPEL